MTLNLVGKSKSTEWHQLAIKPLAFVVAAGLFAHAGASLAANSLAGTAWQLQSIQSMDDAQGTTTIPHPERFTLKFGDDGRASFQLDCNRGTGTWQSEVNGTDTGKLSFGPLATTRAMCPSPHTDQRVARDMAYVRSFIIKDGKLHMALMADGGIYTWQPAANDKPAASVTPRTADKDRTVKPVQFPKGANSTLLKGRIRGYNYIDYQLRAGAGQHLKVTLKGSNPMGYFNILPPDSTDAAMFIGSTGGDVFEGLLPDDGVYTLRVYLMRAGARRNEANNFALSVAVDGARLLPVSNKLDAVIPGTPFHASTTVPCTPAYSQVRECKALVIRRGFNGTATVELRWDNARRRILFINGKAMAWDSAQTMTSTRNERGWIIQSESGEQFDIPEPLVNGG